MSTPKRIRRLERAVVAHEGLNRATRRALKKAIQKAKIKPEQLRPRAIQFERPVVFLSEEGEEGAA